MSRQADPNKTLKQPIAFCRQLMAEFAAATGLTSSGPVRRYLWTDAFAVCNFLALYRRTGEPRELQLAKDLIDQVHHVLGRHRDDDPRSGWISGLDEEEGARHPLSGGLRIGKPLGERGIEEPFDERLEWERDGQYYHYLTKWMHALDQTSRVTGEGRFNTWAKELAKAAHAGFIDAGLRRLHWKMSIDLSRPLVPSMGHHDPLEGFVTFTQLEETAKHLGVSDTLNLSMEIAELASMCAGRDWSTGDPLGLGGLLSDACRLMQMTGTGESDATALIAKLLEGSLAGLHQYARSGQLRQPAEYRLAFRELGLAIGLKGLEAMQERVATHSSLHPLPASLAALAGSLSAFLPIAEQVDAFWLAPENRKAASWADHRDINGVMLVTSLIPEGFWGL